MVYICKPITSICFGRWIPVIAGKCCSHWIKLLDDHVQARSEQINLSVSAAVEHSESQRTGFHQMAFRPGGAD
jgi:hypothetical protein